MVRTWWISAVMLSLALACSFNSEGGNGGSGLGMTGTTGANATSTSSAGSGNNTGETSSASQSATGESAETTTGPPLPSCQGGGVCIEPPPDGWAGPVVLATWEPAGASVSCPDDWVSLGGGGLGVDAPDAQCQCECSAVPGRCEASFVYYADSGCSQSVHSGDADGDCAGRFEDDAHPWVIVTSAAVGSSCEASGLPELEPAAFEWDAIGCEPPALGECETGTCMPSVPAGFGDRYCIVADGAHECPEGPFTRQQVVHASISDERTCSDCKCSMAAPPVCGGALDEHTDVLCLNGVGNVAADGTCRASNIANEATFGVEYNAPAPAFTCAAAPSVPIGEALGLDPVTYCCTP